MTPRARVACLLASACLASCTYVVGTIQDEREGDGGGGSGVVSSVVAAVTVAATSAATTSGGNLDELSDELGDAGTLESWIPGTNQAASLFDIGVTTPGHLTVEPLESVWYKDSSAFVLSKHITGDFMVQMQAEADNRWAPGTAPTAQYNSVGLIARDPDGAVTKERWIVWDVGMQGSALGSEARVTTASKTDLFFDPGGRRGELTLCRLGQTFHLLRRLEGEIAVWEAHTFELPDLPATLEVGVVTNAWSPSPNLRAVVDYVRFGLPTVPEDCRATLPPAE